MTWQSVSLAGTAKKLQVFTSATTEEYMEFAIEKSNGTTLWLVVTGSGITFQKKPRDGERTNVFSNH